MPQDFFPEIKDDPSSSCRVEPVSITNPKIKINSIKAGNTNRRAWERNIPIAKA